MQTEQRTVYLDWSISENKVLWLIFALQSLGFFFSGFVDVGLDKKGIGYFLIAIALMLFFAPILQVIFYRLFKRQYCIFAGEKFEYRTSYFRDAASIHWLEIKQIEFSGQSALIYPRETTGSVITIKAPLAKYDDLRAEFRKFAQPANIMLKY